MILPVHARLREHIAQVLSQLYGLDAAAVPSVVLESPPNRDLGDLGTPVAFELARRLRKAPRAIAAEIAAASASVLSVPRTAANPQAPPTLTRMPIPSLSSESSWSSRPLRVESRSTLERTKRASA